jgi:hypothetical protein
MRASARATGRRRCSATRQVVGERRGIGIIALSQLRQGAGGDQRARQRQQRAGAAIARAHARHPPEIDRGHHAGRHQPRDETGARQRRFAGAARSHDQQERRPASGRRLEAPARDIDDPVAAEKHRRVLGLERRQAPERRALILGPPQSRAEHSMGFEPLPQQLLELHLESVGVGKAVIRRFELPFLRPEPLAPECFERIELTLRLAAALGIGGRHRCIGGLAKHVDVRHPRAFRRRQRGEQLIDRPRRIGPAIGHAGVVGRELGADAGPEDRHHDIAGCRLHDLRLEARVRLVESFLPKHRLERDQALIGKVELGGDRLRTRSLGRDIAG